jgi:hypothetical protein
MTMLADVVDAVVGASPPWNVSGRPSLADMGLTLDEVIDALHADDTGGATCESERWLLEWSSTGSAPGSPNWNGPSNTPWTSSRTAEPADAASYPDHEAHHRGAPSLG